jgi:hypothetical protein
VTRFALLLVFVPIVLTAPMRSAHAVAELERHVGAATIARGAGDAGHQPSVNHPADIDRDVVLAAQDVPPELLLAAAVVFVIGAVLAATIGWRLWRREG